MGMPRNGDSFRTDYGEYRGTPGSGGEPFETLLVEFAVETGGHPNELLAMQVGDRVFGDRIAAVTLRAGTKCSFNPRFEGLP
jgi:hypothetical protein